MVTNKDTNLYVPGVTFPARDNQKVLKVISKGQIRHTNINIFPDQILLKPADYCYSNQDF